VLRRYAADEPDAFAPDLVTMLLATTGRAARIGRTDALAYADEAVRMARGLAGAPAAPPVLAEALYRAITLEFQGRPAEAVESLREAVALGRRLAESDTAGHVRGLMRSVGLLDMVLRQVGRDEEVVELWRDAVAFLRPRATTADIEEFLVLALERLGVACRAAGRPDDAIAALGDAIGYRRRQAGHDEGNEFLRASARQQRSFDLATVGRPDEARRDLDEATAILQRLADRHPDRYGAELERAVAQAQRQDAAAAERPDT
jgi:tetratricopeptide (TPR) repeat protein